MSTTTRRRKPTAVALSVREMELARLVGGGVASVGIRRALELMKRDERTIRTIKQLEGAQDRFMALLEPDDSNLWHQSTDARKRARTGRTAGDSDHLASSRGKTPLYGENAHRCTVDLTDALYRLVRASSEANLSMGLRNLLRLLHFVLAAIKPEYGLESEWPPVTRSTVGARGAAAIYALELPKLAAELGVRWERKQDLYDLRVPRMGGRFGDLTVRDYRRNPRKYEDRARVKEQRDRIIAGRTANYMRDGMSEEQARAEALRSMGAADTE